MLNLFQLSNKVLAYFINNSTHTERSYQIGMFHFEEHDHFSMLDGYLIFLIQEFMDMKIDLQKKITFL